MVNWKKVGKFIPFIGVSLVLIYLLEGYGVIGITIVILTFASYRAWKLRDNIKLVMRQLESMIWGKPLDKDAWGKGEMKDTKVEVYWGKGHFKVRDYIYVLVYPSLLILFLGLIWEKGFLTTTGLLLILPPTLYKLKELIGGKNAQKNRSN